MESKSYLDELIVRYPVLDSIKEDIIKAYEVLEECYENGNKLLIAGNGGSASDAEHIVGELMKSFIKPRHMEEEFISKLISCDEQYGKELGAKLQGGLPRYFAVLTPISFAASSSSLMAITARPNLDFNTARLTSTATVTSTSISQ